MGAKRSDVITRWHKVKEFIDSGKIGANIGVQSMTSSTRAEVNLHAAWNICDSVDRMPKYFIDRTLMDMLDAPGVSKSMEAMMKAQVMKLPFPACMVEFDKVRDDQLVREFVILREREVAPFFDGEEIWHPWYAMIARIKPGQESVILSPFVYYLAYVPDAGEQKKFGIHWYVKVAPWLKGVSQMAEPIIRKDVHIADTALSALILLLNTQGVHREVVECQKLNGIRKKRGQPSIPEVTRIKVGRVYKRDGTQETESEAVRRTVRVHWRSGHYRGVRYGKGRELIKQMYFPPKLVNFIEGKELPSFSAHVRW